MSFVDEGEEEKDTSVGDPAENREDDEDRDDDGSLDVQHYPLPPALLDWLRKGMTDDEIAEFLGGELDDADDEIAGDDEDAGDDQEADDEIDLEADPDEDL